MTDTKRQPRKRMHWIRASWNSTAPKKTLPWSSILNTSVLPSMIHFEWAVDHNVVVFQSCRLFKIQEDKSLDIPILRLLQSVVLGAQLVMKYNQILRTRCLFSVKRDKILETLKSGETGVISVILCWHSTKVSSVLSVFFFGIRIHIIKKKCGYVFREKKCSEEKCGYVQNQIQ